MKHRNRGGRPELPCQQQRQSQRKRALLSPQTQFLSTQLHRVLLWVCLTTSSCCWQRGQGSPRFSDKLEKSAITRVVEMRSLLSFSLLSYYHFSSTLLPSYLYPRIISLSESVSEVVLLFTASMHVIILILWKNFEMTQSHWFWNSTHARSSTCWTTIMKFIKKVINKGFCSSTDRLWFVKPYAIFSEGKAITREVTPLS